MQMIPKVIHYCWFGGKPLPKSAQKCIESWKKYCKHYDIIEWNETNFDINSNAYVKQAYEAKKYAFVTDYVRLYALYTNGGIYMDTDVEVVANLDQFLVHQAFTGFEDDNYMVTGIMACEKGFPLFKELLDYYTNRSFLTDNGELDITTNTAIITDILTDHGFVSNGKFQERDGLALYPRDVFCPFNNATGELQRTKNTATIHWFNKSWIGRGESLRLKITRPFHRVFGINCFRWLKH